MRNNNIAFNDYNKIYYDNNKTIEENNKLLSNPKNNISDILKKINKIALEEHTKYFILYNRNYQKKNLLEINEKKRESNKDYHKFNNSQEEKNYEVKNNQKDKKNETKCNYRINNRISKQLNNGNNRNYLLIQKNTNNKRLENKNLNKYAINKTKKFDGELIKDNIFQITLYNKFDIDKVINKFYKINKEINFEFIKSNKNNDFIERDEISFTIANIIKNKINNIKMNKEISFTIKESKKDIIEKKYKNININKDKIKETDSGNERKKLSNINDFQDIMKKSINDLEDYAIVSNSLIGLKNLGNTCYLNSSLQILLHVPEFIKLMLKNKDYEDCHIYYINKIINLLINSYKNSFQYYIDPSDFVRFFKNNHKRFEGCTQRDTQMFLDELLWEINSELSLSHDQRPIEKNFYLPEQKGYYEYLKKSDKNSNYIMNDLFYVCFIHEKKCKNCDKLIFYFDETPGLKLNFNNIKGNNINLLELIKDNYMSLKYVNSSIPCERCKQYLFELKTRIARLPKILIIVLQKTNENETKKIPCVVNYEKNLDLIDFVKKTLIYKKGETQYSLYAINDHYGLTPFFGHYCSYIYLEKFKTWFSFDDTAVTTSTIPEPNLYNYVLFFFSF